MTMELESGWADVIASNALNGDVRLNLGTYQLISSEDTGGVCQQPDIPIFGVDGFLSRPNDPDVNGCSQAYYVKHDNQVVVIGSRDQRQMQEAGEDKSFSPGDRAIVTKGPARVMIKQASDTVSLYTESRPDSVEPAATMMVTLDGEGGMISIICGKSWINIDNDEIHMSAGGTEFLIDKDGVQITGQNFTCNTAGGTLGTIGGLIPPVKIAQAILCGPAGMAGIPAVNWTINPLPG